MATCCYYSFNDKFLHEIKHVQSFKFMSTYEHLPANVLKRASHSVEHILILCFNWDFWDQHQNQDGKQ